MRIGIDIYSLSGKFAGIGVYLYNILNELQRIDGKNEYFLYSYGAKVPFQITNPRWHLRIIKGVLNRSRTLWMQVGARKEFTRDGIDIFWSPEPILPLNLAGTFKTVITLYDLVAVYFRETMKWDNKIIFPLFFRKSLEKAGKIIVVSVTTMDDLLRIIPSLQKKLRLIYCGGAGEQFRPFDRAEARKYVSLRFDVSARYVLDVATLEPRKNLTNLLRAFKILIDSNAVPGCQLLIAGGKGWNNSGIYRTYKELNLMEEKVKFIGYLPNRGDLVRLYAAAEAFVFPSLYEGFGLPPLEAMACGTPVVASDIPIFREILSDAALLVNPHTPESIAEGIQRILTDKALSDNLKQKGLERVKMFSWEKAARQTLDVFMQL